MNYYPFHIGDYAVHTRHLSLMEDLAYRRCLDLYYTREAALPADVAQVARLIGMREQVAEVETILKEFFTPEDEGCWVHMRCDVEIKKAQEAAERARTNGKAGGRPVGSAKKPSANPEETQQVNSGNPDESKSKAPITQDQYHTEAKASVSGAKAPSTRGARLAKDWILPKPWGEWAIAQYPHWTPDVVRLIAQGFGNHWKAKAGKDATKLDWEATWQNWCMSDITQRAHPPPRAASETVYQRSMREKYEQVAPAIAARRPGAALNPNPMEVLDGLTRISG